MFNPRNRGMFGTTPMRSGGGFGATTPMGRGGRVQAPNGRGGFGATKPGPNSNPNIFDTAANATNAAIAGTQGLMGYQPGQIAVDSVAAQTYDPSMMTAPNDVVGQGYRAARINGPDDIRAGQIASTNLNPYMNKFDNQVIRRAQNDLERQRQMNVNDIGAAATAAGAFGGSRHGVAEALTNEAYARAGGDMSAGLRQGSFDTALSTAGSDIANRLVAGQANQRTGLQTGIADQNALNAARSFGAGAINTANTQNQNMGYNVGLANQGAANTAGAWNAGAQNAMGIQNQNMNYGVQNANVNNGLRGAQFRGNMANQLGNMGQNAYTMGSGIQAGMARDGAFNQMIGQSLIDAGKGQYGAWAGFPEQTLGYLNSALSAAPTPQTQTNTKSVGLMDALTMGATAAPNIAQLLSFSDQRLKTNIKKIGELPNGIDWVSWDWTEEGKRIAGDTPTTGVIAQQVKDIIPDAVVMGSDGYYRVNYAKVMQ